MQLKFQQLFSNGTTSEPLDLLAGPIDVEIFPRIYKYLATKTLSLEERQALGIKFKVLIKSGDALGQQADFWRALMLIEQIGRSAWTEQLIAYIDSNGRDTSFCHDIVNLNLPMPAKVLTLAKLFLRYLLIVALKSDNTNVEQIFYWQALIRKRQFEDLQHCYTTWFNEIAREKQPLLQLLAYINLSAPLPVAELTVIAKLAVRFVDSVGTDMQELIALIQKQSLAACMANIFDMQELGPILLRLHKVDSIEIKFFTALITRTDAEAKQLLVQLTNEPDCSNSLSSLIDFYVRAVLQPEIAASQPIDSDRSAILYLFYAWQRYRVFAKMNDQSVFDEWLQLANLGQPLVRKSLVTYLQHKYVFPNALLQCFDRALCQSNPPEWFVAALQRMFQRITRYLHATNDVALAPELLRFYYRNHLQTQIREHLLRRLIDGLLNIQLVEINALILMVEDDPLRIPVLLRQFLWQFTQGVIAQSSLDEEIKNRIQILHAHLSLLPASDSQAWRNVIIADESNPVQQQLLFLLAELRPLPLPVLRRLVTDLTEPDVLSETPLTKPLQNYFESFASSGSDYYNRVAVVHLHAYFDATLTIELLMSDSIEQDENNHLSDVYVCFQRALEYANLAQICLPVTALKNMLKYLDRPPFRDDQKFALYIQPYLQRQKQLNLANLLEKFRTQPTFVHFEQLLSLLLTLCDFTEDRQAWVEIFDFVNNRNHFNENNDDCDTVHVMLLEKISEYPLADMPEVQMLHMLAGDIKWQQKFNFKSDVEYQFVEVHFANIKSHYEAAGDSAAARYRLALLSHDMAIFLARNEGVFVFPWQYFIKSLNRCESHPHRRTSYEILKSLAMQGHAPSAYILYHIIRLGRTEEFMVHSHRDEFNPFYWLTISAMLGHLDAYIILNNERLQNNPLLFHTLTCCLPKNNWPVMKTQHIVAVFELFIQYPSLRRAMANWFELPDNEFISRDEALLVWWHQVLVRQQSSALMDSDPEYAQQQAIMLNQKFLSRLQTAEHRLPVLMRLASLMVPEQDSQSMYAEEIYRLLHASESGPLQVFHNNPSIETIDSTNAQPSDSLTSVYVPSPLSRLTEHFATPMYRHYDYFGNFNNRVCDAKVFRISSGIIFILLSTTLNLLLRLPFFVGIPFNILLTAAYVLFIDLSFAYCFSFEDIVSPRNLTKQFLTTKPYEVPVLTLECTQTITPAAEDELDLEKGLDIDTSAEQNAAIQHEDDAPLLPKPTDERYALELLWLNYRRRPAVQEHDRLLSPPAPSRRP